MRMILIQCNLCEFRYAAQTVTDLTPVNCPRCIKGSTLLSPGMPTVYVDVPEEENDRDIADEIDTWLRRAKPGEKEVE